MINKTIQLKQSLLTQSLINRKSIESNKQFKRLNEKTQVLVPENGLEEVTQSRLTHSYEVATSAFLIASILANDHNVDVHSIDYKHSVINASLLHDIGHPPFGHNGGVYIDQFFYDKGYAEGFSDNNNNLIVIEKNNIVVTDYTKASIIKYPSKLFEKQKEVYLPILEKALEEDRLHYEKIGINLKPEKNITTIACQIMDEADRNTYVGSDLADFFCLGNSILLEDLQNLAEHEKYEHLIDDYVLDMFATIKDGSKNDIKEYFSQVTTMFNFNHTLNENGLTFNDPALFHFREYLSEVCKEFFIKPISESERHKENMEMLVDFLNHVYDEEFYPSKYYEKEINQSNDPIYKLEMMRNMVSEVSDWYIFNFTKAFEIGKI